MRTSRRTRETSPPLSSRGTVHAGRPRTLPSTLPSSLLPPAGSAAATSEIVLDVGTCEVMNNRQCVIWRYDSPAVDVLDADEAELICAAQIADCLSLPARVVAPPWMRHLGWGRAVSRGGRLRARGRQSSKSAATDCRSLTVSNEQSHRRFHSRSQSGYIQVSVRDVLGGCPPVDCRIVRRCNPTRKLYSHLPFQKKKYRCFCRRSGGFIGASSSV